MIVEGVAGHDVRHAPFRKRVRTEARDRDLRIGEDNVNHRTVVDRTNPGQTERVPGGEFALHDRHMHDLVRSCAIAARVDVRLRGLLPFVDRDPTVVEQVDAGRGEIE